jgi:SAM-dependent methyltransferase
MQESMRSPQSSTAASVWVNRFLPLIKPGGLVLDLAAGSGRHVRLLRDCGFAVCAVDRDTTALLAFAGPCCEVRRIDLETDDRRQLGDHYDGIIVTNYLHRPLLPAIARALAPGGVLIYETFARGNERFGRPSNPDFLLRPGELLEAFTTFTVVATQTARLASSEAANPRVPVPKFRVVSLSLTCASRDLTFWRLRTLHASGSQAREESLAPQATEAP